MKRPHNQDTRRHAGTTGDIKKDLSTDQLAGIGAVALAFSKAEDEINNLFCAAAGIDGLIFPEINARINGIAAKIEIIKSCVARWAMNDTARSILGDALGNCGFTHYKKLRDAIIHARVINAAIGIGISFESRNRVSEVLLTTEALNALYDHLVCIREVLSEAQTSVFAAREISALNSDDPRKAQLLATVPEQTARLQRSHNRKQSLPPLPEFPEESQFRIADDRWTQETQPWLREAYSPKRK